MNWRVIFDTAHDASYNMAVDEAIMLSQSAGDAPPTLRFYAWQPAALSIGYFQKVRQEVNIEACRQQDISIIRRITGGRAVLHDAELTYSIAVREDHKLLPPTLLGSYRVLSQGLIAGLRALNVPAEMTLPGSAYGEHARLPKNGACFDAPSFYEITVDRKKLLGSAQVRKEGILLQHGSLLCKFDAEKLVNLLLFTSEEERERSLALLKAKATSLQAILGHVPDNTVLAQTMAEAFAAELGINLVAGELTTVEQARASKLIEEKYGTDDWNFRK